MTSNWRLGPGADTVATAHESLVFWASFAPCFVDRISSENRLRFQKKRLQSINFKIIKFFKTEVISSHLEFTQFASIPRGFAARQNRC